MSEHVLNPGFLENLKILFVALIIYVIIFALLKKTRVFGDDSKINSLVALLAAIIVSFSGVVTYAVSYAINWFFILFFIVFLLIVLLLFLGISMDDISKQVSSNGRVIVTVFIILFALVIIKGFFALNNAFDPANEDPYLVDTTANTGIGETIPEDTEFDFDFNVSSEIVQAALFLLVVGIFVLIIGRG